MQATEELVRRDGFAAVGTRQIAERAGVSVGSLYQYFPTYESILLGWYEQVAAAAARTMKVATVDVLGEDLETSVRVTLKALLKVYEQHEIVLVRMPREVPEVERATQSTSFEHLNRGVMRLWFAQSHQFDPAATEQHIFFLETLILGVCRRWVADRPRHLSRPALLAGLAAMVLNYLESHLCEPR